MALTIRLNPEQEALMNKLQKQTDSPASKSLMIAAAHYVFERNKMVAKIEALQKENERLKADWDFLSRLLKQKYEFDKQIQEAIK